MVTKKSNEYGFIKPLFSVADTSNVMGKVLLEFTDDNYNKELGGKLIDADNDAEAIESFLNEYRESPETLRSYTKEIERLLLWCIYVSKTNISSLRRDHLIAYQDFLKHPTPRKQWCGPSVSRTKKDGSINSAWRPFVKGLGASSLQKTIRILDSFFNYLVQMNYLIGNPLAVDRRRKKRNQARVQIIDRYLELDEIQATLSALSQYPANDDTKEFQVIRAQYIILLLFYSGLRITEAANHAMGNFIQREGNWFLRVVGKGSKLREIPMPDELKEALADFRLKVGLPSPEPKFREKTPLIPMQNLKQSISPRRIDQILNWHYQYTLNKQLLC